MSKTLTELDFQTASQALRCEIAAIKAVAEVESRGAGFYADGFPVILFERHKFHKFTGGKFDKSHPEISNPVAGGYGPAGQHQRDKFNLAFSLDPIAAMMSCSWGKFQVMGFNYKICGFNSVNDFVDAMKESEGRHLQVFVSFVIANNLAGALRNKKWAVFAEGYNGEGYAENRYDTKMAAAYEKHLKDSTDIIPTNDVATSDLSAQTPLSVDNSAVVAPSAAENNLDSAAGTIASDSTFKDYLDKYGKHCKDDSVKNIFFVVCGRVSSLSAAMWALGITGKILIVLIGLLILGFTGRAIWKYRDRLKQWGKDLFDWAGDNL